MKSRIRALTVVSNYERDYEELVKKLRLIDESVDSIKNSKNLKGVFEIILIVGNYMNDSAKQAKGFKLNSLQRLSFMKDDKNSMTFLHYVEKVIRHQYPELLDFINELSNCNEIAKFSIENINNDCKEYVQNIKNVQSSIDVGNLSDISKFHPLDRVLKTVLPNLPRAKRKSELLLDQVNYTMKEFENLMLYFGEDTSDTFVKNSFISKFTNFIKDFKRVQSENMKREEELRIYEQRKKLLEIPKKEKSTEGESEGDDSGEGDNETGGVMDGLLQRLKAAAPVKGESASARKRALMRKQILDSQRRKANSSSPSSSGTAAALDEDIIEDNKATSPIDDSFNESSMTQVGDEDTTIDTDNDNDNVGSRAKNLLSELRGTDESPSPTKDRELLSDAQKYRRQRLKTKSSTTTVDDAT